MRLSRTARRRAQSKDTPLLKNEITRLLVTALEAVAPSLGGIAVDPAWVVLERTRDAAHGDFACNCSWRATST